MVWNRISDGGALGYFTGDFGFWGLLDGSVRLVMRLRYKR